MRRKILITGGSGFIGSRLALACVDRGHEVTVLDNLSPQVHGEDGDSYLYQLIKNSVSFIRGDVRAKQDWHAALEGQDAVVHLAAETGTGQSMYMVETYADTNVLGTALLLDVLANEKHKIQKVVVASSRAVYGEGKYHCTEHGVVYPHARKNDDMAKGDFESKCPVCVQSVQMMATDEEAKIHPTSVYGITKRTQEEMVMAVCKAIGIDSVALRYQNVYGPGQSLSNPYTGILSIFSTRITNGNDINVFEDGLESRDFVFISDAVEGTILAIERDEANGEVINVGSGKTTPVLKVAESLVDLYRANADIGVSGDFRLGDIRHNVADLSKIGELLGFTPKIDFQEGLRRFTEWASTQECTHDRSDEACEEMKKKGLHKKGP